MCQFIRAWVQIPSIHIQNQTWPTCICMPNTGRREQQQQQQKDRLDLETVRLAPVLVKEPASKE